MGLMILKVLLILKAISIRLRCPLRFIWNYELQLEGWAVYVVFTPSIFLFLSDSQTHACSRLSLRQLQDLKLSVQTFNLTSVLFPIIFITVSSLTLGDGV